MQSGNVYVSSFSRGKSRLTINNAVNLNVTSCQAKSHPDRLAFSPMHLGPFTEEGNNQVFNTFEGWWQGQKRYPDLGHIDKTGKSTPEFYAFRKRTAELPAGSGGELRHPKGTKSKEIIGTREMYGKECNIYRRFIPQDAVYLGDIVTGYVESRKQAYVPVYHYLIKDLERISYYTDILNSGVDILIYDLDGPKNDENEDVCMKITIDMLKDKINDPTHPFGHGYVVGATLLGITPNMYC